jgi:adenylate cyclase class IV
MIEVEKRSFITKNIYDKILTKYQKKIITTKQITYYFNGEKDFRIMFMKDKVRLWLKEGHMHDDYRQEYEVLVDKQYGNTLLDMLHALGYSEKIKWYRIRNEFIYEDINITLDYTEGYGYIIEGEILIDDEQRIDKATSKIEKMFNDFDINVSNKQQFTDKYNDYVNNWLEYTKNANEETYFE